MSREIPLFAGAVKPPERKRKEQPHGIPVIKLRDYQSDLMNAVRRSMAAGHRRVVMQAPTGAGKQFWLLA